MDRFPDSRPRHLAAVWIADLVGYSVIASRNEDEALRLIDRFQEEVRRAVTAQEGRLVKFTGDGAIAEFAGTEAAALSAQALRGALEPELQLRVGLHVGDVFRASDGDLLGDGINLAARLQAEAAPGEILLSDQAWRHLRHRETVRMAAAGERALKGQQEAIPTYRLLREGEGELPEERRRDSTARSRSPAIVQRLGRRGMAWSAVVILLLVAAFFPARAHFFGVAESGEPLAVAGLTAMTAAELDPARIAVLYFDDHSSDGRLGYLTSGLTEALISELSELSAIEVVSLGGVKPFRGTNTSPDSIARALRAGTLVQGAIAASGSRVRVAVLLTDGRSETVLARSVVERDSTEHFALIEGLVAEVTEDLRQELGREIRNHEIRRGTESEAAYELVMRASYLDDEYSRLRKLDPSAARLRLEEADSLLAEAERQDPSWTEPVVRRGWSARRLALLASDPPGSLDPELGQVALGHAERAGAMDESDPAVLELRGTLRHELSQVLTDSARRQRLLTQGEQDLRRATRLDPGRAFAWGSLSHLLLNRARFAEALLVARRALEEDAFLENGEEVLYRLYEAAMQIGPTEEARALCDEGRARYPQSDEFILCQLMVLVSFESIPPDVERAEVLADSLLLVVSAAEREAFAGYGTMFRAQVAARAGDRRRSEALVRAARGDSPDPNLAYNEAQLRITLGDPATAIELLRLYLRENPDDKEFVARDWWFETLWNNPEFKRLVGAN